MTTPPVRLLSFEDDYEFPAPIHHFVKSAKEYQEEEQLPKISREIPPSCLTPVAKYPDDINPPKIVQGKPLPVDVVQLLSNNGVRDHLVRNDDTTVPVHTLKGKYLLICCVQVPLPATDYNAGYCRSMIQIYPELSQDHNFEMVMVAKMRPGFESDQEAFNHFFSAFPCPAIPFPDSYARDYISKFAGLVSPHRSLAALLVDQKQFVLQTGCENILDEYGAAAFPFTPARLANLKKQDLDLVRSLDVVDGEDLKENPPHVSLARLLGLPSSCTLKKLSSKEEQLYSEEEISIAVLAKKKCVAVYLCADGLFMKELHRFHEQCIAQKLEFEVVVVFTPFGGGHIPLFLEDAERTLKKRNISSWWLLHPVEYKDTLSRKLWRLFSGNVEDQVVVIVSKEKVGGDLLGKEVMKNFGMTAYPFTRFKLVEQRFSHLKKSCNLKNLLMGGLPSDHQNAFLLCKNPPPLRHVPMAAALEKKRILLYFDYPHFEDNYHNLRRGDHFYCRLFQSYRLIKMKYPHTEVVFVPLEEYNPKLHPIDKYSPMPWLILPSEKAASVVSSLFFKDEKHLVPGLVAFDGDGQILSRCAENHLLADGRVDDLLFADTIHDEIMNHVHDRLR